MKQITGTYIVDQIREMPFSASIPSTWAELDAKQYATIIQVLHYKKADPYTINVSLLTLLFGKNHYHILEGLPADLMYEMLPKEDDHLTGRVSLIDFLLKETPPVKNFFTEIKIRKKKCAAPADDLSNLSFGEWCFVYQFFHYYQLDGNASWLNKMIAVLYRPIDLLQDPESPGFKGDIREIFNENLIEKRAKDVAAIESRFKLAILAWFTVALMPVTAARPHVFPPVDPDAEPSAESGQSESGTWLTVFRELLGPKWGTIDQLKNTNAMFILDALEEQQIAYEEAMSKAGSQN